MKNTVILCKASKCLILSAIIAGCSAPSQSELQNIGLNSQNNFNPIVLRSEYERAGEILIDLSSSLENGGTYRIVSGNGSGHYTINNRGEISVAQVINDTENQISQQNLTVEASKGSSKQTYNVKIVDGFDYLLQNLTYTKVLSENNEYHSRAEWTAQNNLWGRKQALENTNPSKQRLTKAPRMVTLISDSMPNNSYFLWDTPGESFNYGNATVWSFQELYVGGSHWPLRKDVDGFPIRVGDTTNLTLDFNYQPIGKGDGYVVHGEDNFKVGLNMFFFDSKTVRPFEERKSDLGITIDQLGNYVPTLPQRLPDVNIGGKSFSAGYDPGASPVPIRRVIIKNRERALQGNLDLRSIFDLFTKNNMLSPNVYVPSISFGVEVSKGFGAVAIKQLKLNRGGPRTNPGITVSNVGANPLELKFALVPGSENNTQGYTWCADHKSETKAWEGGTCTTAGLVCKKSAETQTSKPERLIKCGNGPSTTSPTTPAAPTNPNNNNSNVCAGLTDAVARSWLGCP